MFGNMKAKSWLIMFVLILAVAIVGGYATYALQPTKPEASQLPLNTAKNSSYTLPKSLSELIAEQIESGVVACPKDDLLTYETCLLFQGALGVWQRVGLPENCPNIIDPRHPPLSGPKSEDVQISGEDVLKAVETPCFGHIYAINVANTTPILVSTANRTYQMAAAPNYLKPGSDPELCLSVRHGSCGNHSAVATAFFERAGFKARPVEFYYEYKGSRLSHITPEVWINGHWRLIDSTYGAYWTDEKPAVPFELMPTEKILTDKPKSVFYNSALLPFGFQSVIGSTNYFAYISERADVIRGGTGKITLTLKGQQGSENFLHKPNFVGDNISDHQSGGIQFRLVSKKAKYRLTVNLAAAAISNDAKALICIDESCEKHSDDKREYSFLVKGPSRLYLKTDTDVAYIVLKSLDWKVVSN